MYNMMIDLYYTYDDDDDVVDMNGRERNTVIL